MFVRTARRSLPMATKFAQAPSVKKARTIVSDTAFREQFEKYADHLNRLNDRRERLVKASRDVTMNSKKVIFQVHRVNKHNKEVVLEQAEKDLSSVTAEYMSRVAKELQGDDFWKLRRAYSPGVQEYVEAATVIEFCKTGRLLTLADLNNDLSELSNLPTNSFKINLLDYLLGVGDLTGELMRLAISHVADGEVEVAKTICNFVRDLYKELSLVAPDMDDNSEMNKKMDTMLQSLVKIENDWSRIQDTVNILQKEADIFHLTVWNSETSFFLLRRSYFQVALLVEVVLDQVMVYMPSLLHRGHGKVASQF